MNIRGLIKTSLIDYPGKISAVVFTGGCNLRCGYCYNPEFARNDESLPSLSNEFVLDFLKKRSKILEGVTISGGEPTLSNSIVDFISEIKTLGLAVKLDTNGFKPKTIKNIIESSSVDYFSLDIKTSPEKYNRLTQTNFSFENIIESLNFIKSSGIDYEIRTTCIPEFFSDNDIDSIRLSIGRVKRYYLQQFIGSVSLLNPEFSSCKPYSVNGLKKFLVKIKMFSDYSGIRGI